MWFSYNSEDGFEIFKTEVEAKASALMALKLEREESQGYGEWRDDEVTEICWGKVIQKVGEIERGEDYVDYGLKDCEVVKTLTCVYCGMAYPEGTPPYGAKILTDHIKVCEKHPMHKLRDALVGLVGASTKEELEKMELVLRATPGIEQDKIVALNAIHALIETGRTIIKMEAT